MDIWPNFYIVGAAKCATTSLMRYLEQHPEIFFCRPKEPHYFSSFYNNFPHNGPGDSKYDNEKQVRTEHEYLRLFENAGTYKVIAEASTEYLYYSHTAADIYRVTPKAKILISLRNPVDRAISAYKHLLSRGQESKSFEKALIAEEWRISQDYKHIWFYQNAGLYYSQVAEYLSVFPESQVKIILYEDIEKDIEKVLREILIFLGLDTDFKFDVSIRANVSIVSRYNIEEIIGDHNKIGWLVKKVLPRSIRHQIMQKINQWNYRPIKVKISQKTRHQLKNYFKEDIIKLQTLIKRDLSNWIL